MRLAMKTVDEHFEGFRFANEVELQTALQAIAGATDALHYQVALRKVQSCHELSDTQKLSVLHAIFEVVGGQTVMSHLLNGVKISLCFSPDRPVPTCDVPFI